MAWTKLERAALGGTLPLLIADTVFGRLQDQPGKSFTQFRLAAKVKISKDERDRPYTAQYVHVSN
jgi:hypothetical protein